MRKIPDTLLLAGTFLLFAFLEIWKIGSVSVFEWDEARYGIHALGMIQNDDFVNYYYLGTLDIRTGKPPLANWLIAGQYLIFGKNEWALRFHSVWATLLWFWVAWRLVSAYKTPRFACLTLLLLAATNGIIGFHVGRTGDADALLILFETAAVYFYLQYLDVGRPKALLWVGPLLGLGFLAKSVAVFFLLPGLFLYTLLRGRVRSVLFEKNGWITAGGFLVFPAIYFGLIHFWGEKWETSSYGGDSLWTTMLSFDILRRFTENIAEGSYDPLHIVHVLDINFNLWNYLFYLAVGWFGWRFWHTRDRWRARLCAPENRLLTLSFCIIISLSVLLTVSYNKHQWYFAPAWLFVAVVTVDFLMRVGKKYPQVHAVWAVLLVFTLSRKIVDTHAPDTRLRDFFRAHQARLASAEKIYTHPAIPQHYHLYLAWSNPHIGFVGESRPNPRALYFLEQKDVVARQLKPLDCIDGFCIAAGKNE